MKIQGRATAFLPPAADAQDGYRKVAVSDRVVIEKSVGSQLAVPMSLDIRQNSYAWLLIPRNLLF